MLATIMTRSVYSSRYKRLRDTLIAERERHGITQAELAARLGRPQSFISKVESGERRVDVIELLELLDALGTDHTTFLKRL